VEVIVVRAVFAFELNRRVPGHVGDGAVDDSDGFPRIVLERRRANVLTLVAGAGWAEGHRPATDFAVVVALLHGIIVAAVAFAAAGCAFAAPASAAVAPNL
jgi:hypothetical protein